MAIVIKSNVVANDPQDLLPYYTPYGVSKNKELVTFAADLAAEGYTLKANEFTAFESFINTLKDKGVWSKVIELYPLVGDGIGSAGIKLASATSISKMTPMGDFTVGNLEFVGGVVVGKKRGTSIAGVARNGGFNTHVKASALTKGYGIHAYTQQVDTILADESAGRALWGATHTADGSAGTFVQAIAGTSLTVPFRVAYRGGFKQHTIDSQGGGVIQAVVAVNAVGNTGTSVTVFNGTRTAAQTEAVVIGSDIDRDLYLFARNGYGANNTIYGQYNPAVRFAMLTDGTVSEYDNSTIQSEIMRLMNKLGRVFT